MIRRIIGKVKSISTLAFIVSLQRPVRTDRVRTDRVRTDRVRTPQLRRVFQRATIPDGKRQ
jgi:hypothetical protein